MAVSSAGTVPTSLLAASRLFRRWREAAGIYRNFVPSAPFAALAKYFDAAPASNIPETDALARTLAELLLSSPEAAEVVKGNAAFVLDIPGYLALAVGYYLQEAGIAPVSLLAGYYQPQAILNGQYALASLQQYGLELQSRNEPAAYAFLLERERNTPVPDLSLLSYFDNRYFTGLAYFPSPAVLLANNLFALIDVRAGSDFLPDDLADYYRQAAAANLDVLQILLPLADLPV